MISTLRVLSDCYIRIWKSLTTRRRSQFKWTICLMIFISVLEMLSVGSVLPLLAAFTNIEALLQNKKIEPLLQMAGIVNQQDLILWITILFILVNLLCGFSRILLIWITNRLSYMAGAELGNIIFYNTLNQPYKDHITRNSNKIIDALLVKVNSLVSFLMSVGTLLGSLVIILSITFAMFIVNIKMTLFLLLSFGAIYYLIIRISKKNLDNLSLNIHNGSLNEIKIIQEALGGIREVIINGLQKFYCKNLFDQSVITKKSQATSSLISSSPRYLIESIGIGLIAFIGYKISLSNTGFSDSIPALGALVIGMQRILPNLQQFYATWTGMVVQQASLIEALSMIENRPIPVNFIANSGKINFENELKLKNINFKYGVDSQTILSDISITIKQGMHVGICGRSGAGKSTLVDIIIGLLEPTSGEIQVDGVAINNSNIHDWRKLVSHVPQLFYISNASIAQNIAFGIDPREIDRNRIIEAAKKAHIHNIAEACDNRYEEFLGEGGIRLSGGQRQRIAIARALYKKPKLIVFDEATSNLDNKIEQDIMNAISLLGKEVTVVIIAHRLSTLRNCDLIIELDAGKVIRSGTYDELFGV